MDLIYRSVTTGLIWALLTFNAYATSPEGLHKDFQIADVSDFEAALKKHVVPAEDWVRHLNQEGFDLLCLGETHAARFRELYADLVLMKIESSTLALEATNEEVSEKKLIFEREGLFPLLGADASALINAFLPRTPQLRIVGIEQTSAEEHISTLEKIKYGTTRSTRDGFIAQHIDQLWTEGETRVVSIYGALHCSYESAGLGFKAPFMRILKTARPNKKLVSVLLIPPEQNTNVLRVYMDSFRLAAKDTALVNPSKIHPAAYNYRTDLRNLFQSYDVILLPKARYTPDDEK